jgi:hypothetical protein
MVRQAHHDREKTVRPELVEGCPFRQGVRLLVIRTWCNPLTLNDTGFVAVIQEL